MEIITLSRFKAMGWQIPNADSKLKITIETGDRLYSKVISITYKGKFLIKFKNDWGDWCQVIERDDKNCIKTGLVLDSAMSVDSYAIVDALYYIYNPATYTKFKNKTIKAETIKWLSKRLADSSITRNKTTQDMLAIFIIDIHKKATDRGLQEDSNEYSFFIQEYITNIGFKSRVAFCHFSREFYTNPSYNGRYFRLDNNSVYVSEGVDVTAYNLTKYNGSSVNYLLYPDQFVWNNRIFSEEDGYRTCRCCNNRVPTEAYNEDTGECSICENRHYEIHGYTTKAPELLSFKAKNVKTDTIYLGCELEYETTDVDQARLAVGRALKGHAIMKRDGSISHGFEIVSCPATLDIHLEEFKNFFDKLPKELKIAKNVGMHVHVSRKPLSVLTVGKLTAFMNNSHNSDFLRSIAGREQNNYCRADKSRTITFPWTSGASGERFNMLNLRNKDTIEFRIFSTPISFHEFAYKMQFCRALVDYCKPAAVSLALDEIIKWENFVAWTKKDRSAYPELSLTLKGI